VILISIFVWKLVYLLPRSARVHSRRCSRVAARNQPAFSITTRTP